MKAAFYLLLLIVLIPLGLTAAPDASSEVLEGAAALADGYSHDGHGHSGEESKLTMISEKFGLKLPTLIAQMVNFCLVAAALYFFAVKPVAATLDDRQKKIADGLQYAEEMKTQLAEAERERAEKAREAAVEAQALMAEAREQAKEMIEKKTQEAAAQAEAIIRKANEAIELDRQKMLSDVRQEVARLVVATSSKVLTRELSDEEKAKFSDAAAKDLVDVA